MSAVPSGDLFLPVRVIRPGSDGVVAGLRELWQFRELVFFFALRNISVRYKQTLLGMAWVVIQPLAYSGLFGILFGRFAGLPSGGKPYPLYALCGMIPWMAFANAFTGSSLSVVGEQSILKKVYFPKLASVFSSLGLVLVDGLIQCGILLAMIVAFDQAILATLPLAAAYVVLAGLTGVAAGIWFAALNVRFRDVQFVLPFIAQFWMYLSPVAYSGSIVPEPYRALYSLNPVAPLIDGFREAALGVQGAPFIYLCWSVCLVILSLIGGVRYFKRVEVDFADVI